MEWETIIYYYPLTGEAVKSGAVPAAKKHWFQEAALRTWYVEDDCDGQETVPDRRTGGTGKKAGSRAGFRLAGCAIPPCYYKRKPWKPQTLAAAMEETLRHVEGMTDTWLHPQVGAMLTEEYAKRWRPRQDTLQAVVKRLADQYADTTVIKCGEAAALLGEPADTDWQMQMTRELLTPYLPRINRLLIFCQEEAGRDIWLELGDYLDEYYYEYGLVPQLVPYAESAGGPSCGKPKCSGLILDYGAQFRYPKIPADSRTVYIDTLSVGEKERAIRRKTPQIPYVSPLKYLDTVVKNSYDRLGQKDKE